MPKTGNPAKKMLAKIINGNYPHSKQSWHYLSSERLVVQLGLGRLCINLMLPIICVAWIDCQSSRSAYTEWENASPALWNLYPTSGTENVFLPQHIKLPSKASMQLPGEISTSLCNALNGSGNFPPASLSLPLYVSTSLLKLELFHH